MVRWPDKSFSVGVDQPMAWKETGIMIKPSVQLRFVSVHSCQRVSCVSQLH
jgi:hypothetical protein